MNLLHNDSNIFKKNVLLVDDELDILDFLTEYIEEKDLQVFHATNIEVGLQIASESNIDLVFLDNNLLSNVRGVEYIPEFKKLNPRCRVYMLTANVKPEVRSRAEELGANGFISKPFDFQTLDQAIDQIIQDKGVSDEKIQ